MDIEKHIRERERLNRELNDKLTEAQGELENFFKKYGMDVMPELAHDVSCFVIEELYLKRFRLSEH